MERKVFTVNHFLDSSSFRYDEVVSEAHLVKLNEEGLALQEKLKSQFNGISPYGQGDQMSFEEEPGKDPRNGPLKIGKFMVPTELTDILSKDWDIINNRHHLFVLPAAMSSSDLLEEFCKVYRKKKIVGLGVFDQFLSGLKSALDEIIGRSLLYKFEKVQLSNILKDNPNARLSEVYPSVMILRYLCIFLHVSFC